MDREEALARFGSVLRKRDETGGRHLHHRDCIHNLPPERQLALYGRTAEWWTKVIGPLPEQITPDQWETDPPEAAQHTDGDRL